MENNSIGNPIERAELRLKWAERDLDNAKRDLRTAQEWLRNTEHIYRDRQRELAEIVKANPK